MTDTRRTVRADASSAPFHAIVDAETVQTATTLVDALVDECHLLFDGEGLRLRAMDPATVAAVDVTLAPGAFDSYDATDGHLGVNVARLRDIVRLADRDQLVAFTLDAETRRLTIDVGDLTYTLALLDSETVRAPPDYAPDALDFTAHVVADASHLGRAVTAAEMVSDHIAFGTNDEERTFYAEAEGDTDDVFLSVEADSLSEFDAGDAHTLFSLSYLRDIDRALGSDFELALDLGTEMPLRIEAEFADGAAAVDYFLAPRIARS